MNLENHNNESFSRKIASAKLAAAMHQLTVLTSRSSFSLSLADLEEIEHARKEGIELIDTSFQHMIEKARERRDNLSGYEGISFVSLGEDCFVRTVLTRWGLKPSSNLGEKSCPFDLSVHRVSMLPAIIRSDFDGYLDLENFSFRKDLDYCQNNALKISFNHEKGSKYAENDFEILRDVYRRRIANFRELLAADGRIVFLIHISRPRSEICVHIKNTMKALNKKRAGSEIKLICVNTWKPDQEVDFRKRELLDGGNVSFVDVHYPYPKYVWHLPVCCFSPEGHLFEKNVISKIKEIVDEWTVNSQSHESRSQAF